MLHPTSRANAAFSKRHALPRAQVFRLIAFPPAMGGLKGIIVNNAIKTGSTGFSHRSLLAGVAAAGSAPILATTVTPAMAKVSQAAVAYQNSPKNGQSCADCNLFLAPSACKMVNGAISPNGWRDIWVKKVG